MKSFNQYFKQWDLPKVGKIIGIALLAVSALAVVVAGYKTVSRSLMGQRMGLMMPSYSSVAPGYPAADYAYSEEGKFYDRGASFNAPELSTRNVMPIPPMGGTVGDTAEDYEVTDYSAHIESGNLDETCGKILDLKAKKYVVFESSNKYDRGCSYGFKVKHENVPEVLSAIEALDPKELSENTYTIKRQIDDFTSQEDTWKNKLKTIDETLKNAGSAYDQITRLATQNGDVATLAKIIDSKIQVIERLTQERIQVVARLEELARAKTEQLDRLEYTYFNVSVTESRYVDGDQIRDSWKAALREFVETINKIIQGSTISLISFLFFLVYVMLYGVVILYVAKYAYGWAKKIWKS